MSEKNYRKAVEEMMKSAAPSDSPGKLSDRQMIRKLSETVDLKVPEGLDPTQASLAPGMISPATRTHVDKLWGMIMRPGDSWPMLRLQYNAPGGGKKRRKSRKKRKTTKKRNTKKRNTKKRNM